jgi:hypothetical protein
MSVEIKSEIDDRCSYCASMLFYSHCVLKAMLLLVFVPVGVILVLLSSLGLQ